MAAKTESATPWGDPATNTFRKTNIREATQGDARANLHRWVKPLAEELWAEWDQGGVKVDVATNEKDQLGLSFLFPEDVQLSDTALEQADRLGWVRDHGLMQFAGTAEWARAKGDEFQLRDLAELATPFSPKPEEADHLPGSRTLKRGDSGKDVEFLQVFLGVKATGTYDAATQKAMISYRSTHGLSDDGDADEWFWAALIPFTIRWRRMGDAGREVRAIQAALIVFGYQPGPATGRYGVVTNRAIYALKAAHGVAGSAKIDSLVWAMLFDLQFQRFGVALQGA